MRSLTLRVFSSLALLGLFACSGGPTQSVDTGDNVECGHGTHQSGGECVANDDTAADTDTAPDTNGDTDTGVVVTDYQYCLDGDSDDWAAVSPCFVNQPAGSGYKYVDKNSYSFDCSDGDADTFPGAASLDSLTACMTDLDGDGYGSTTPAVDVTSGTDCDDAEITTHPGAAESVDNVDNDCDGYVDRATWYLDEDCDGLGSDVPIQATAADVATFPDCWVEAAGDCDDSTDTITDGETYYADMDGDGYADAFAPYAEHQCSAPEGYVALATVNDCDDTRGDVHPGAEPLCELDVDADCNGALDQADDDGDSYASCDGDCDDTNDIIFPGAAEICDGLDNNCDTFVDVAATDAPEWYGDADSDGYGNVANTVRGYCTAPAGYVGNSTDCNDANTGINPSASEVCNGIDDDCDVLTDDADPSISGQTAWYYDGDADTFGAGASTLACYTPAADAYGSYVSNSTDCDDDNGAYHPGAATVCELGIDANCDGSADAMDGDGDGYAECEECDDTNASVYPGASEFCNSEDDDCDGSVDESAVDASVWYQDADADSYGNVGANISQCDQPVGYVSDATDCDDASNGINPGASEVCDDLDDDCDGLIDDADSSIIGRATRYYDADSDGYGDLADSQTSCEAPAADSHGRIYVDDGTDCLDTNSSVYPGAAELVNGIDDNCDGSIDEVAATDTGL